jgi:hypothetical protein
MARNYTYAFLRTAPCRFPAVDRLSQKQFSDIIRRMITNLITAFQQVGNLEKVEELIELRGLPD